MTTARPYAGPDRRLTRPSPLSLGLAAAVLAAIAFATLCPIGLRPHLASADQERFAAYFLFGAAVSVAAGRRALAATALVVLAAFALEAAQGLAPGRDPAVSDAVVKALGGVLGSAAAQLIFPLRRLIARTGDRRAAPAIGLLLSQARERRGRGRERAALRS